MVRKVGLPPLLEATQPERGKPTFPTCEATRLELKDRGAGQTQCQSPTRTKGAQ
jgi:hypothetical protein